VVGSTVSIVYTTDRTAQTGWTAIAQAGLFPWGFCVAWNGIRWVAGGGNYGANSIAHSTNGTTWTGLGATSTAVFPVGCASICWNGTRFVASSDTYLGYSQDGLVWYSRNNSLIFSSFGYGIASNPGIGAFVAPSAMVLNNNGISGNGIVNSQTLEIVSSDPYYQLGFTNVSVKIETDNIYT
jgi:hypothetical protein